MELTSPKGESNGKERSMLVLARRAREKLIAILPDKREIKICIVRQDGPNYHIGIDAPRDISIVREEIRKPAGVGS